MPILTSVVSLSNPTSSDQLNSGTAALKHATQHSNANDEIEKIEQYLLNSGGVPACRVYQGSAQTISNITETTLLFDTEAFDSDTMHSTSSNTGRITFTTAGLYIVAATLGMASDVDGYREINFRVDGTTYIHTVRMMAINGASSYTHAMTLYRFTAGQYVEMRIWHSAGGNLNTNAGAGETQFEAVRVGG